MLEVTLDWRASPFPFACFVLSLVVLVVEEGADVCREVGGASVGTLGAGLVFIRLAGCENGLPCNLR